MEIKQIHEAVNTAASNALGQTDVVNEDLSNIVDVGTSIFNAGTFDKYVRTLVDKVGRMIFVNRPYQGIIPSIMMDGWMYGSVLQKVQSDIPDAVENETWELQDGQSYDPNIFYKPKVEEKFYDKRTTFEVDRSFTDRQVRSAFNGPSEQNAFISMLYNDIEKGMTLALDNLKLRTITNMIGETFDNEYGSSGANTKSGVRAVNVLYLYNLTVDTPLTKEDCLYSVDFLRFASRLMSLYVSRMKAMSTLFNVSGTKKFTPSDELHVILLDQFKSAADFYLQSSTFHDWYTELPISDTVPYWQGPGNDYEKADVVNIVTTSKKTVNISGVLGVMFDRYALGVTNFDRRATTNYNPKAEFWSTFNKFEAGFFNDLSEQFVFFFVA